jgi:NADH-quinone oxidoreductase subunit M
MVSHGLSAAALLLAGGFLVRRYGAGLIAQYGGVQRSAPVLAGVFLFAGLATLALPGLSGFAAEFLVLAGTYPAHPVAAVLAAGGVVLSAVYVLWLYQRTMTGPVRTGTGRLPDLVARERAALVPLFALTVLLGVFPQPVLAAVGPAVAPTAVHGGVTATR